MAKFMGFSLTSPAPEKCDPTAKNRVWGFFGGAPETSRQNRPQSLQPRRENHPTTTKVASGRAYWPSRDPIGERGGINLYGMVGNDAVNLFDLLGLDYDTNDLFKDEDCCEISPYWVKKLEDIAKKAREKTSQKVAKKESKKKGKPVGFEEWEEIWIDTIKSEGAKVLIYNKLDCDCLPDNLKAIADILKLCKKKGGPEKDPFDIGISINPIDGKTDLEIEIVDLPYDSRLRWRFGYHPHGIWDTELGIYVPLGDGGSGIGTSIQIIDDPKSEREIFWWLYGSIKFDGANK
jgi:hypothetical protein